MSKPYGPQISEHERINIEKDRLYIEIQKFHLEKEKIREEHRRKSFDAVIKFAEITIRSLLILNGGSALAVLTFASSRVSKGIDQNVDKIMNVSDESMARMVIAFGFGALLSVLTAGWSYLSQHFFTHADTYGYYYRIGVFFQCFGIFSAIGSAVCFYFGINSAYFSLTGETFIQVLVSVIS